LQKGEAIRYEQRYDFDDIRQHGDFLTTLSGANYLDAHIIPAFTEAGVVKEYIGEFVDITERKRVEKERESIAKFPEENPDPVLRIASSGLILFANSAAETLLQMLNYSDRDSVPAQWVTSVDDAYQRKEPRTVDIVAASRVFQMHFVPVAGEGYVNVYGTDITQRKDAEDALRQSRQEVQSLNEGLTSANEELRIVNETLEQRVNERTEEIASINKELRSRNEQLSKEIAERIKAAEIAKERAQRDAVLNEIIHVINEAVDQQTLFERTLATTIKKLKFERGLVVTVADTGFLDVPRAHNVPAALIESARNIHVDDDPYGHTTYWQRELVVMEEVPSDFPGYHFGLRGAFVGIPFVSEGSVVGGVLLNGARRSFKSEDHLLFETIGLELGTAVTKLRARARAEEYARRQEIINHIIKTGNEAGTLQTAIHAMLDAAMELLQMTNGTIYLLNEAEGMIELQYARGFSDEVLDASRRFPRTTSYYPRVYSGESVFIDDYAVEGTEPFRTIVADLHVMAVIPLSAQNRVIGNYVVSSSRTSPFTNEERDLLVAIGQQAGTVIARLRAEESTRQHARRAEIMRRIIVAGNQAESLQSAVTGMVNTTMDALSFDAGGIFLREDDAVTLQYARGYTPEQRTWAQRIPLAQRRVCRVMAGTPWISSDYQGDVSSDAKHMNKNVVSMATVPLVAGDAVIGFYQLADSRKMHHFTAEDVELLVSVGHEAGTVIARLQAEEALKDNEARSRDLIERSFDAVIIHSEGKIRFANTVAARVLKAAGPEALVGKDILDIPTAECRELGKKRIESVYGTRVGSDPAEMQYSALDGSIVDVEVIGTHTTYAGKPAVYVAFRDISVRKRTEEQLKRYSEHLEELVEERSVQLKDAERLAGIGETAAMIGHDLRNPLQGLQYIVDLQRLRFERIPPEKRGADDWTKEVELFDRISEQVFYMDKIVADLQDYARPITPEPEKLAVSTLINDVLSSLPHTDHVKIISDVTDLEMMADAHLMHRVFANLVLNAIQAMPEGGTLTITASRFNDSVAINLHDTGVGIPEEMKGKLFLPLSTGKAKGTGLGLAVVKRVVDAHGGTITFESGEGEGTTFTVTLPSRSE
jgi:PAS domain S-box-containing protein